MVPFRDWHHRRTDISDSPPASVLVLRRKSETLRSSIPGTSSVGGYGSILFVRTSQTRCPYMILVAIRRGTREE